MTTPNATPTPAAAPDKLTTIGSAIISAVRILEPIALTAAGVPNAAPIAEATSIALGALQGLLANHNVEITFGDLEAMRLKPEWPDAGTPVPSPTSAPPPAPEPLPDSVTKKS